MYLFLNKLHKFTDGLLNRTVSRKEENSYFSYNIQTFALKFRNFILATIENRWKIESTLTNMFVPVVYPVNCILMNIHLISVGSLIFFSRL
jgi:hypothetical protein